MPGCRVPMKTFEAVESQKVSRLTKTRCIKNDHYRGAFFKTGEMKEEYKEIFRYFDDWAVVKTNKDKTEITGFLIRKNQGQNRIETFEW